MKKIHNLLENKTLLIFDFDGTIANTSPFHEIAFNEALKNYKVDILYEDIAGLSSLDAMKSIFFKHNILISNDELLELVQQKQNIARSLISEHLEPVEGLSQFLSWASGRFKMCIVSSGSRLSIKNALNKIKLHHYFDKIICAEDVQYSKPNPEGFNKALDIFEVNPENALIFEDSSSGFQAAIEAQINYVDVNSLTWLDLCKKYT